MLRYYLSNRQEKELSRGNRICIAVPAPPEADNWPDGVSPQSMRWAAEVIDIGPQFIVAAKVEKMLVSPVPSGTGLQAVLGRLVLEDEVEKYWTMPVELVLVILNSSRYKDSNSRYPPQWPGSVTLPCGTKLPK